MSELRQTRAESGENGPLIGDAAEGLIIAALRKVVGDQHVLTTDDLRAGYETDWSRRWSGSSLAVVRPADTNEVSMALALCNQWGVPCVPQGGRTGLVGGSVPFDREIVLSLERLDAVGLVDADLGQVTVGAGTTLALVHEVAATHGWEFGVDLASRESATIGGMIATNAGGIRVIRYGQMREQVVSLEVVLADGSILRGSGEVLKDNAGYDIAQLIIGSEGTLGVITSARLRLVRSSRHRVVSFVGLASLAEGVELVGQLHRTSDDLAAAEFIDDSAMKLVCEHLGSSRPVAGAPWYVLVECAGDRDPTELMAAALEKSPGIPDERIAVALDVTGRQNLWRFREQMPEAIARKGIPHKLDVGLPHRRLDDFAVAVRGKVQSQFPDSATVLFGHLGESNIHVNVLGVDPEDDDVDDAVLRLVAEFGGNIASEHGIGRAKTRWLELARTQTEIETMHVLKSALDPKGLLNPGVIFEDRGGQLRAERVNEVGNHD